MHFHFAIILLACFVARSLGTAVNLGFNCNRNGQVCSGSFACTIATGACDCTTHTSTDAIFRGPDCGGPTQDHQDATCTLSCENGGKCYNDGAEKCYCIDGYTGATCTDELVDFKCEKTKVGIKISVPGTFDGKIYVQGHETEAACQITEGDANYKDIDYTACSIAETGTDPKVYTLKLYITYREEVLSNTDQVLTATCTVPQTSTATPITKALSVVNINTADIESNLEAVTGSFEPDDGISLAMTNDVGSALPATVAIGSKLKLKINLTPGVFQHYTIKTITAKSDDAGTETLELFGDGCARKGVKGTFVSFDNPTPTNVGTDDQVGTLALNVFKFKSSATVFLTLEIILAVNDASGERKKCDDAKDILKTEVAHQLGSSPTKETRRRRRAAGDEGETGTRSGTMNVVFRVQDLSNKVDEIKGILDGQKAEKSCVKNIVFLLPLILLSVMLLVSMAMTLFFCLKVTRRNAADDRKMSPDFNMGYKG